MSPYDVLQVSSKAADAEVRAAYKAMAKKWHPDRRLDDQETATKKFKEINTAYRAILHERRRDAREHSPTSSSSSKSSSSCETSSSSSSNAASPDNCHRSSRSKTIQKDAKENTKSTRPSDRVENADGRNDHQRSTRRKREEDSLEKSSKSDDPKSPSSSRPSTASSHKSSSSSRSGSSSSSRSSSSKPTLSSSSQSPSPSFPSSRSSTGSRSDSDKSDEGPKKDRVASGRTSVRTASTDSLHEQNHDHETGEDHYPTQDPGPAGDMPFFTSYTSSEDSAYDNPEITPPGALNKEPCDDTKPTSTDSSHDIPTPSSPPARPPEEKSKSSRSKDSKMPKRDGEHEERTLIPEYDCELARSVGVSKQWTYTIRLTLNELFRGKKLRFRVIRCKFDGKRKSVILDVNVPAGTVHGTQIIFRGAGHERKDKTRQDIVFIIEEAKHERFVRVKENLALDVRLPWVDSLKTEVGVVHVKGIDGKESKFEVDFKSDGNVTGTATIPGAGMPVPGTENKGNLIVRWEIFMPSTSSRWETFKQALHL